MPLKEPVIIIGSPGHSINEYVNELGRRSTPARIKGRDSQRRLSSFANHVRQIACDMGTRQPNGRPLSAISKLLMQLHPHDGFIYDKFARETLRKILDTPVKADGVEKFITFAETYPGLFCGIRDRLDKRFRKQQSDLQPARIVDKFLWLQSSKKPRKTIKSLLRQATSRDKKIASEIATYFRRRASHS